MKVRVHVTLKNGVLDPMLTAWLANILFLSAGVFNLIRVKK